MKIEKLTDTISLQRSMEQANIDHVTTVREVISDVKENGDQALFAYTEKWDGVRLSNLKVSDEEMEEAFLSFEPQLVEDLKEAADNIRLFHEKQIRQNIDLALEKTRIFNIEFPH